jgi:hypothetical protein
MKRKIKIIIRRLLCHHKRTFEFFPSDVWWSMDGKEMGKVTHGLKVICCMDCGDVSAENYAK